MDAWWSRYNDCQIQSIELLRKTYKVLLWLLILSYDAYIQSFENQVLNDEEPEINEDSII